MSDELDDLKSALHAATPAPDPDTRAAHLALAQKGFDDLQGSQADTRHTPVAGPSGLWTGVKDMFATLTSRGALTATTALVACAVLVLGPVGDAVWRPAPDGGLAPVMMEEAALVDDIAAPAPVAMTAPSAAARASAEMMDLGPMRANEVMIAPFANTETFANADESPLKITRDSPVSTFSIDVDTASYAVVRSAIMRGQLPPADAVRIEEMINYFDYAYPAPAADGAPFLPRVGMLPTPWNPDTQLVHIGIQGQMPAIAERPPLNLVFLIDTSGSMEDANKLPLLRQSFLLMLDQLRPEDEVAIVTYAGSAGEVLAPTSAAARDTIRAALDQLAAAGSTNGVGGLEQAYATARDMTQDGDVSRVILATDGDFNVGLSDPARLEAYIADKRDSGIYLSVLGFGRGNLQDATMQALAQNGNGTAAYIDTLSEAQKVLVDQLTGALFPIASDVKLRVEFDPSQIAEYRLIGYETRALNREDFHNDRVDAGELGAGHSVTALYEVTPVGSPARLSDPLRYTDAPEQVEARNEIGFLKMRYKAPGARESVLLETPILRDVPAGPEAQFAAAIAGFGQVLRGSDYIGDYTITEARAAAQAAIGPDPFGYRAEALRLMQLAASLKGE